MIGAMSRKAVASCHAIGRVVASFGNREASVMSSPPRRSVGILWILLALLATGAAPSDRCELRVCCPDAPHCQSILASACCDASSAVQSAPPPCVSAWASIPRFESIEILPCSASDAARAARGLAAPLGLRTTVLRL